MKMYIKIEGDDDANGAYCEINCDLFFLKEAIINLFQSLISCSNITPALTCLKECIEIAERKTKGGDRMYEVIIAGGPSDGRIIGEFQEYNDARDMATAFNESDAHHEDEVAIVRLMEV